MASERSPELAEVVRAAVEAAAGSLYVAIPARVEKLHTAASGLVGVDVQPLVKRGTRNTPDGERIAERLPVVPHVPVLFPGGGGFRLTFPVSVGDVGLLVTCDRSLDAWLSGTGQEVDPEIDHAHALQDGVFVPQLRTFGAPWSSSPTDHATIGKDDGPQIHLGAAAITIGDTAGSKAIGLHGDNCAVSPAMATWMNNVAAGILAGGGGVLTPLVGTTIATVSASATQAKAK